MLLCVQHPMAMRLGLPVLTMHHTAQPNPEDTLCTWQAAALEQSRAEWKAYAKGQEAQLELAV